MGAIGLDLSPSALAVARERYGEGVTWLEGDFFDEALAARCDVEMLFEHTFFCTIAPSLRWSYVEAATRWLGPGGRLIGVFFSILRSGKMGNQDHPTGLTSWNFGSCLQSLSES